MVINLDYLQIKSFDGLSVLRKNSLKTDTCELYGSTVDDDELNIVGGRRNFVHEFRKVEFI